tara:strand:+ start:1848 stop:2240 length:393 start_codon:yes stop_codon:yes gene_type:complete
MTIKTDILRDLQGDLMDSDHVTRRYFRCWLDGGYDPDMLDTNIHYLRDELKKNGLGVAFENAITPWVVSQFVKYTAHDAKCSYGYAQKVIVEHFRGLPNPSELDFLYFFTNELIGEAIDLIADDIKAEAA